MNEKAHTLIEKRINDLEERVRKLEVPFIEDCDCDICRNHRKMKRKHYC